MVQLHLGAPFIIKHLHYFRYRSICQYDTAVVYCFVKAQQIAENIDAAEKIKLWQKTSYANLIRYTPSGVYYCRIRVRGQLIRKSLKTDVLSVAKLRLT